MVEAPNQFKGVLIAYEDGDEPEEDDDEINDDVSGESGEEEPEDILIVEADKYPDESSPEIPFKKDSSGNPGFSLKHMAEEEDSESEHSVQMDQSDIDKCVYGGDIYLLGGQHYIKDNESSASTATTAFGLSQQKGSLKKRTGSRKKWRAGAKSRGAMKGITNSILEEDEDKKTEYGGEGYNSVSNFKPETDHQKQTRTQEDAILTLNLANMTEKQRKHAIRDEYLRREPN